MRWATLLDLGILPWWRGSDEVCVDGPGPIEGVMSGIFASRSQLKITLVSPYMKRRTFWRRHCQRTPLRQPPCNTYANFCILILLFYSLIHFGEFGVFAKFKLKSDIGRFILFRIVDDLDSIWIEDADTHVIIISFPPIHLIVANLSRNSSDFKLHRSKQQDL